MEASMSSNTSFSPIEWKAPKYFIAVALVGGSSRRDAESAERKIETMTENETTRSTQ